MNAHDTKVLQRDLNAFFETMDNFHHVRVDGEKGHATNKAIRTSKWFLGYLRENCNASADAEYKWRLENPNYIRTGAHEAADRRKVRRGQARRRRHHVLWVKHQQQTQIHGVGHLDGKLVANWIIPYAKWAREHNVNGRKWQGYIVSGWRDPVYSTSLCYRMCGRPSCPGMCAGASSNHSGSDEPRGAIDVSDYVHFGAAMHECPLSPRLFNNLPRDRVHFSATGN